MKRDIQDLIAAVEGDLELLQRSLSSRLVIQDDNQILLEALKKELNFVEDGGYANLSRPALIFEDSPICPNYPGPERRHPCHDCALMKLVPREHQENRIPCRHIPLNPPGETLASLYRTATQRELEWEIGLWLKTKIAELEYPLAPLKKRL